MIKIVLTILSIIFFFISGDSLFAEANENTHTIRYTAPETDFASITPEEEEMLIEMGWNLDADIPYWDDIIDFSEFTHSLHTPTDQRRAPTEINLNELFDEMDRQNGKQSSNNNVLEEIFPNSVWNPIFSVPPHGTKVYYVGDMVHCNRFNGSNTDHKHYSNKSIAGIRNFWRSDCNLAVGYGYCTLVNDNCNTTTTYHRGWCSQFGHNNYPIYYHLTHFN